MALYKTEAVILKRINLGEADKIVTAISPDHGKIKFIAKGVRRIKSRLAGSIEPFYQSNLVLATGKNLDILSSGDFIRAYIGSDSSLIEIKTATFFVEVIDRLIPEKEPLPDLYKLLVVSLAEINRNPRLAKLYFESHFYRLSGVFPDTTNCVVCGNREDEPINFSPRLNGVVCSLCSHKTSGIVTLQQGVIPYWEKLAKGELPLPPHNDSQLNEGLTLSDSYMRNLNTKEFKSDKI